LILNLQLETAKAFVIALEGELKVADQNKESYSFHDITRVVSGGCVVLQGICSGTPPRKGAMIVPINSPDENMLKVEDVAGSTVILVLLEYLRSKIHFLWKLPRIQIMKRWQQQPGRWA